MAGERSVKIKFLGDVKDLVKSTSLAGAAMKRFEKQSEGMAKASARLTSATKALVAPNAVPALAALAIGAIGAGVAAASAAAPLGVFGAVLAKTQTEVAESATKLQDLADKSKLYSEQAAIMKRHGQDNTGMLKKQAAAQLQLQAQLNLLPPAQREATEAYMQLKSDGQDFIDQNKPATFKILARGYRLLGKAVLELQPLFDIGRKVVSKALTALEKFAAGGGIKRFVAFLTSNAKPAIASLTTIVSNLATFLGALFGNVVSDGQGFLHLLAEGSAKLAEFGSGGGLTDLLDSIRAQGPGAFTALAQIAGAALQVATAVAPLAPITLAIAQALASLIAALPPQVITALVAAWVAYNVALTGYNTIVAVSAGLTKIFNALKLASAIATVRATVAEKASTVATVAGSAARRVAAAAVAAWTVVTNALSLANLKNVASIVATTVATVAMTVAGKAAAAASKIWAAAQWLLNVAMTANPVGLIIAAIVALIAIIVLIATKTTWFQTLWKVVWGAIQAAAKFVADWFMNTLVPSFKRAFDQFMAIVQFIVNLWKAQWNLVITIVKTVVDKVRAYINAIVSIIRLIVAAAVLVVNDVRSKFNALIDFIKGLPGRVSSAARGLFDGIKNAFRSAINFIIDRWNNLSFSLPSVNIPGIGSVGGGTLNTPNIGRLASGGWMQPGQTYLTGERGPELLTASRRTYVNPASASGDGVPDVHVYIGDRELTDIVDVRVEQNNRQMRRRAGAFA